MIRITKYIPTSLVAAVMLQAGALLTSCQEVIEVGKFDDSDYGKTEQIYCLLRNSEGPLAKLLEMRTETIETQLYIELSKAASKGVDLQLKLDPEVLTAYNTANKANFEMFPESLVSLQEDGAILIAPGDRRSDPVTVGVKPGGELEIGKTYALPFSVEVQTEGVELSENSGSSVLFVKMLGELPSTDKGTGIVTICYIECNDYDLRNACEWRLAKSGKPLFDIVNIFAANINYLEEEGRIGVKINASVQNILDNRDIYIKPLQDMGVKVCLTILGNHDGTGVANLSDQTAREFAAELKSLVDTYGLDGVDFDDEWSDYDKYPVRPGCVERSPGAYARLCYEVKRAMPDKLCTLYYIGAVIPWPDMGFHSFNMLIDGVMPGDFVDYSYEAMYGRLNLTGWEGIRGMRKSQWGACSIDVSNSPNIYNLDIIRKNGYGVQVIYNLQPMNNEATRLNQNSTFNAVAKKLYDDTGAVWSGKNW